MYCSTEVRSTAEIRPCADAVPPRGNQRWCYGGRAVNGRAGRPARRGARTRGLPGITAAPLSLFCTPEAISLTGWNDAISAVRGHSRSLNTRVIRVAPGWVPKFMRSTLLAGHDAASALAADPGRLRMRQE